MRIATVGYYCRIRSTRQLHKSVSSPLIMIRRVWDPKGGTGHSLYCILILRKDARNVRRISNVCDRQTSMVLMHHIIAPRLPIRSVDTRKSKMTSTHSSTADTAHSLRALPTLTTCHCCYTLSEIIGQTSVNLFAKSVGVGVNSAFNR